MNKKPPIPIPEILQEQGIHSVEHHLTPGHRVRFGWMFRMIFKKELLERLEPLLEESCEARPLATVHPIRPETEEGKKNKTTD